MSSHVIIIGGDNFFVAVEVQSLPNIGDVIDVRNPIWVSSPAARKHFASLKSVAIRKVCGEKKYKNKNAPWYGYYSNNPGDKLLRSLRKPKKPQRSSTGW